MSRGLRNVGIIVAAVLFAATMPAGSSIGRGEQPAAVIIISPPPGLALPVGQAVEVRYRVTGTATVLELWSDNVRIAVDEIASGQEMAHTWAPATPGPHCLAVRALGEGNALLATARCCITASPRGSPVRLPGIEGANKRGGN